MNLFKSGYLIFVYDKYARRVFFSGMCATKKYFSVTVLVVPPIWLSFSQYSGAKGNGRFISATKQNE